MKKTYYILTAVFLSILLVLSFSISGCKKEAAEETTAAETTEATTAAETTAAETTAAETVVAGEEELYILSSCIWGLDQLKPCLWGGYLAEKYWQERGDNVRVKFAGPEGWDVDAILVALEASIAKNPTGLMWIQLDIGEENLLRDAYDKGIMVIGLNGSAGDWPTTFILGTDQFDFGKQQALKLIEIMGKEEFNVACGLAPTLEVHRTRLRGAQSVFEQYPGINFAGEIDQGVTMEDAVANASAFITSHPEVDAYIGLVDNATAGIATALKDLGFKPGEKIMIGGSKNTESMQAIEEGYIQASQDQSWVAEVFYSVAQMHFIHNNVVSVSNNDSEIGFIGAPKHSITSLPWITKDNIEYFKDQKPPEGFENFDTGL